MKTFESFEQYDPDMDYRKLIEDIIDNLEIKFELINSHGLYYFYNNDIKFIIVKKHKHLYIDERLKMYYNNAYNNGFRNIDNDICDLLNVDNYRVMNLDKNFKSRSNSIFNENI